MILDLILKLIDVAFHLIYGSLICVNRLQSDRQNKKGCLLTSGGHQYMIIKYLSVGLWSWFSYQQVALNVLFQMRYGSLLNSNKQPSDSLRAEATPVFSSQQYCCFSFVLRFCLSPPGREKVLSLEMMWTWLGTLRFDVNGLYESQTTFPFLWGSNLNQNKPVDPFLDSSPTQNQASLVLGPKLLLATGCVKLGGKNCVHLPSVGEQNAN